MGDEFGFDGGRLSGDVLGYTFPVWEYVLYTPKSALVDQHFPELKTVAINLMVPIHDHVVVPVHFYDAHE